MTVPGISSGATTTSTFGGTTFPFKLFDGTVPDVGPAAAPGKTWYCDPVHGIDSADGTSLATARQTLSSLFNGGQLAAGDTVLLAGGIYREYVPWSNGPSGKAGAPVTIGSYGHGTGAPILDGGVKPKIWSKYTAQGQTTVWQSSTAGLPKISAKEPVMGIYVNSGKGEYALREVIHGQLSPYPNQPLPPNQTQTGIKDNSSDWYFDPAGNTVYADFGATLGTGDPNSADISLLYDSQNSGAGHELLIYLAEGRDYYNFVGLTLRAGSWSGVFTQSNHHTFDHCDFKFNGGAAILFSNGATSLGTGNTVLNSRIWMNILENWPRFNNGNTGGGWPAAIDWSSQSNGLAQGNVVYGNGGEGLTVGNTDVAGATPVTNEVRNNLVFDNFSVNLYVNNTANVRLEQNFVFQHPRDETQTFTGLFEASSGYSTDYGRRITPPAVSLGDEPYSAYDQQAHLANITLINNIFAGGKSGFLDYDDGTAGPNHHALKNCLIANNTWILDGTSIPGSAGYGWQHEVQTEQSLNSILENNIFVTAAAEDHFAQGPQGMGPGIANDYNLYAGPGNWSDATKSEDFSTWKAAHSNWDQHSVNGDAMLTDLSEYNQTATQKLVYDWSKATPKAGSPALGGGTALQQIDTDFTGAKRQSGSHGQGAIAPQL